VLKSSPAKSLSWSTFLVGGFKGHRGKKVTFLCLGLGVIRYGEKPPSCQIYSLWGKSGYYHLGKKSVGEGTKGGFQKICISRRCRLQKQQKQRKNGGVGGDCLLLLRGEW